MRRHLRPKSPGNRRESCETSHLFMAGPIDSTTSTPPRVSESLKITMCARLWRRMHCETPQQRKIVQMLSFLCFYCDFPTTSSGHASWPRLSAMSSGHAFRTCHSNRGTSFSGILGSWVGAQRPRTRGKSFSGFGPDDCEALTTALIWDSCINLCCHQLVSLRLYSNSEHFGVQSLDFEKSSQRTSICKCKHDCDSCVWSSREKVGIDALCQLETLAAQTHCLARNKLLHAMTTIWWRLIQTFTSASSISSRPTGFPRAQVKNHSISALVGFGDSGKGSKFRTSARREKVLHLSSIPCMAILLLRGDKQTWLFTSTHLAETEAFQPPPHCS